MEQKVAYAKSKSDAVAKIDGTFVEKERRKEKRKAEDQGACVR